MILPPSELLQYDVSASHYFLVASSEMILPSDIVAQEWVLSVLIVLLKSLMRV